ncbi:MAG: sensor histidine kinase, partial [Acidimicrobiales bacterium]
PITVIKGYMQTLVRRGDSLTPERKAQALNALESNVSRLERLIEDLLFMSAIEQRSAAMDLRPHDLAAILRAEAGPRVIVGTPPHPVEVEIDDARLARVLHHLLTNALEHSAGEVHLGLVEAEGEVEVSVTDTGPGIFSGDLPYLFDRFRQLDSSSTRTHGGVGIGLYICRRVVEALGGRIWCESRLGVGSRFIFTLPTTSADRSVPTPVP